MKIFSLLFALFFTINIRFYVKGMLAWKACQKRVKEGGFFVMLHDVQYGGELSTPLVTDELNPFL